MTAADLSLLSECVRVVYIFVDHLFLPTQMDPREYFRTAGISNIISGRFFRFHHSCSLVFQWDAHDNPGAFFRLCGNNGLVSLERTTRTRHTPSTFLLRVYLNRLPTTTTHKGEGSRHGDEHRFHAALTKILTRVREWGEGCWYFVRLIRSVSKNGDCLLVKKLRIVNGGQERY